MTVTVQQFEPIALVAEHEDVKLEFVNGRIWAEGGTDGGHNSILTWLFRQFMAHRTDLDLIQGQGLKIDTYRNGRARPDGVLAPVGHFDGKGEWADPKGVLAVIEVTSWDADTHARDRVEKPAAYAATEIPVYLLVDRDMNSVVVHSRPERGEYQDRSRHVYGDEVGIPGTGITLDTDGLKKWFAR
ncbi:Uma2 family endonuclease [Nocardiopsis metallicus]|uniref:Uma2 family endonuclease n=1 Tax=Nocardiopsis metallicus TaxID=179819 RepID=A0A840WTL3_9ACTN|nr:Uma2 family endonuclease [Nocardiopsis metallicus]MBB5494897.1 Uma2 family endonuclease [Nocardiopsis metallicus]